ncbi:MAG: subtilisin-like proprotein convertase family protein [Pseudohongiellaceae bacterium]|jgi:subtilisin-like proprotein convertase family protein
MKNFLSKTVAGAAFVALISVPAQAQVLSYIDTPNVPIPDNDSAGVSMDIVIDDVSLPILSVSVMLRTEHANIGQLQVTLEHVEDATTVTLMSPTGNINNGLWVVLSDDAASPVSLAEALHPTPTSIEDTFTPDQPLNTAFFSQSTLGTWRLTVFDLAPGVTDTVQAWSISFNSPWTDMGLGLDGSNDVSHMVGLGNLTPFSPFSVSVKGATKIADGLLFVSLAMMPYATPLKGGFLGPTPMILIPISTNGLGEWSVIDTWPAGVPPGTDLFMQYWFQDPDNDFFVAATNTLVAITP